MPEYTDDYLKEWVVPGVKIEAEFKKAVAMRDGGGSREYFTDFREAVYSGGTQGLVILLSEVDVDETIVISGGGELTIAPVQGGGDITIRRGAGNTTGSIFNIGGSSSALTLSGNTADTLTVNGGSLSVNAPLIRVGSAGTLTMEDGAVLTNNNRTAGNGGALEIYGGLFVMRGGEISNNYSGAGGGVHVNGGTFTMTGGEIKENRISGNDGGGVFVDNSMFTMTDGKIIWNTAIFGGGVYVINNSTFTMSGGEISRNTGGTDGGGVYVINNSTFTMSGGEISHNISENNCGGVGIRDGSMTMTGGGISGNTGSNGGVSLYTSTAMFNMTGGVIGIYPKVDGERSGSNSGNGVLVDNGTAAMSGGKVWYNSGHGVEVEGVGMFTMTGGEIGANDGDGVHITSGNVNKTGGIVYGRNGYADADKANAYGSLNSDVRTFWPDNPYPSQ